MLDAANQRIAELERSQKQIGYYRYLYDNTSDGFVRVSLDGKLLDRNEAYRKMLGYSDEELDKLTYQDLTPEKWHAIEMEIIRTQVMARGFSDLYEKEYRRKDGSIFPINLHAFLVRDEHGQPESMWAIVRDISEHKRADADLRRNEELYRTLMEATDAMITVLDWNGYCQFANEKAARYQSKPAAAVIGKSLQELLPKPIADRYLGWTRQVISSKQGLTTETTTGANWYRTSVLPVHDASGNATMAMITATDITELKITQNNLLELNRSLEQHVQQRTAEVQDLYDNAPTGYHSLDANGNIARVNQTELTWLGYTREEMLGQPLINFITRKSRITFASNFAHFKQTSSLKDIEMEFIRKDGSTFPALVNSTAIYDEQGNFVMSRATMLDITEIKQAERALRESEQRYRKTIAAADAIPYSRDYLSDCYTFIDEGIERITGYRPEELTPGLLSSITIDGIARGELSNLTLNEAAEQVRNGQVQPQIVWRCDLLIRCKNGRQRWLADTSVQVVDEQGRAIGSVGILQDINERKEIEEALRASEARLNFMFSHTPAMIFTARMGQQLQPTFISEAVRNILGYEPWQFIEDPGLWMSQIHPNDLGASEHALQELVKNGFATLENRVRKADGEYVWMSSGLNLLHGNTGEPSEIIGYSVNIDAQKHAQMALGESEAQNRLLFEEAPDAIALMERSGKFLRVNRAYEYLTKIPGEEMVGKTDTELGLVTPEIKESFREGFKKSLENRENFFSADYPIKCRDDMVRNVESRIFVIKLGQSEQILVITRDISTRKQAEEVLRRANLELERALRIKDEFLASMSHELRTPLTGILGLSEALQFNTYGELNPRQLKALSHIENSGRHLLELINDILDISKINVGKLALQIQPCSIRDTCQASLQLVQGMAQKKQQQIEFSMKPESAYVNGDMRRLKQVLVNLLSNAVKYSPEKSKLGLEVTTDEAARLIHLTVWDHGIGISTEDLKKLFQPFVQLDSSLTRQQGGTGLGLALVQRLVDLHGGSIQVESTPGQGSRFTVVLATIPPETKNASTTTLPHNQRALIVEDNYVDEERLSHYMKQLNIQSAVARSNKTIETALQYQPDFILLAIDSNDCPEIETLAQLRNNLETRHIPVIVTSLVLDSHRAAEMGAFGCINKPFTLPDLREALSRVQNKLGLRAQTEQPATNSAYKPTVMVVDDNEINIITVCDFLETRNFHVISCRSGQDFLHRAPGIMPAIVLLDIQMPDMDGLETLKRLRSHPNHQLASVPVIAVTALAMPGDRERCLAAGADEYLSKPIHLQDLANHIEKHL